MQDICTTLYNPYGLSDSASGDSQNHAEYGKFNLLVILLVVSTLSLEHRVCLRGSLMSEEPDHPDCCLLDSNWRHYSHVYELRL